DVGVHHAVGLHVALAVSDHLLRQYVRRDRMVRHPRQERLAVCLAGTDPTSLLPAVLSPAGRQSLEARPTATSGDSLSHHRHAVPGSVLVGGSNLPPRARFRDADRFWHAASAWRDLALPLGEGCPRSACRSAPRSADRGELPGGGGVWLIWRTTKSASRN